MKFLLLLLAVPIAAGASECAEQYARYTSAVEKPMAEAAKVSVLQPLRQPTLRNRFLAAVEKLSDEQIREIFNGPRKLSWKDVDDLWWAAQTREIKMKPDAIAWLSLLRQVGQREPQLFSGRRDVASLFRRAAKAALNRPGTIEQNMVQAEETLLLQAILEGRGIRNASNKWADRFVNFFSPHSRRMHDLISFDNSMRKSTQQYVVADEPVTDLLAKYAEQLKPEQKSKLESLLADTRPFIQVNADKIKGVYGRDLAETPGIDLGEIRLRSIGAKADEAGGQEHFEGAIKQSQKDMDEVEKISTELKAARGEGARSPEDMHQRELQIRHHQWRNEMASLAKAHESELGKKLPNSEYEVNASWTVTVNHSKKEMVDVPKSKQKEDGSWEYWTEKEEQTKTWTSTYTESGTFTIDASYREALNGKVEPDAGRLSLPTAKTRGFDAVSASNGSPTIDSIDQSRVNQIMNRAARARAVEKPAVDQLEHGDKILGAIRAEHNPADAAVKAKHEQQLTNLLAELKGGQEKVWDKYQGIKTESEVKANWPDDTLESFRERTGLVNERLLRQIRIVESTREQIRRGEADLEIRYALPDYSRQLNELERIRKKARIIQATGAATATAAGGGTGYYLSDEENRDDLRWRAQRAEGQVRRFLGEGHR